MKFSKFVWVLLIALFFAHIGTRPLANPDEGRYAGMGVEMLQSCDWIVPHLNGLIYFEKPPLAYWAIALGEYIFGANFFGARFFNALFSLLTCGALFLFCKRFLSKRVGIWAAFIYGTSALPFGMSQMLTLDNALTFFLTVTLLLFASGFLEENKNVSTKLFLLAYIFMGLTLLTKGLIGIVLPGLIGLPWLIYTGYIKKLPQAHLFKGICLVLLIAAPWHFLVQQRYDCFFNFYFWHEHFERYLTSVHNRTKPFYFLINSFLLGLIPWLFFLPRAIYCAFKSVEDTLQKRIMVFSLLWSSLIVLFFSRSHSQLIPYILPALSGIAIVLAYGISKMDFRKLYGECLLWSVLYFVAACFIPFALSKKALAPISSGLILLAQSVLFVSSVWALYNLLRRRAQRSFYTLISTTIVLYFLLPIYLPYCQRLRGDGVCHYLKNKPTSAENVFCAFNYFNDLPFYLKHSVGTIDCIPEEHTLGYKTEPCSYYKSLSAFKEVWQQNKICYAVVKRGQENDFISRMDNILSYLIYQDAFFSLYSNQLEK